MASVNQGIVASIRGNVGAGTFLIKGGSLNVGEKYLRGLDTMEDTILLWFNNFINNDNSSFGNMIHRRDFKREFCFHDNLLYKWLQLTHAI